MFKVNMERTKPCMLTCSSWGIELPFKSNLSKIQQIDIHTKLDVWKKMLYSKPLTINVHACVFNV